MIADFVVAPLEIVPEIQAAGLRHSAGLAASWTEGTMPALGLKPNGRKPPNGAVGAACQRWTLADPVAPANERYYDLAFGSGNDSFLSDLGQPNTFASLERKSFETIG